MITDRIGVKLHVGDLVLDIQFQGWCTVSEIGNEYVRVIKGSNSKTHIMKHPYDLISLEPHKITNPELFL